MTKLVGIDPDLKGGIVMVAYPDREVMVAVSMPVTKKKPPLNEPVRVDPVRVWEHLQRCKRDGAEAVILERALVMAQGNNKMMGSVDRVHQNFGMLWGLCELAFTPSRVIIANPSVWKKAMGLSSDKKLSRDKACALLPTHAKLFGMVKNTGLAEAMLLAEWGRTKVT